ncbi:MAG: hypothetical protein ACLPX5_10970 [Dissulfurispiraceae bacterium]
MRKKLRVFIRVSIFMITFYVMASIYSLAAAAQMAADAVSKGVWGQEKMQEPQHEKKQDKESWLCRECKKLSLRPRHACAQIDAASTPLRFPPLNNPRKRGSLD